jgi:parvulin-like peptidyl-prolyl isomerase
MTVVRFLLSLSVILSLTSATASAQERNEAVILEDGGVSISYDELAYLVNGWTQQMRDAAIQDPGDRLELLNLALANKRVAMRAEKLVEENPELYWKYITGLQGYQRKFVLAQQRDLIEVPDFTELAREEYQVKKEKIAVNPEKRLSSHILFSSPPGIPRDGVLEEAQAVLDALRNGASFEEMVVEHSDEPNAAAKKGLFNYWMSYGDQKVSPPYSEALFKIEKVGDYSELTQTQFGVHIIRLDGIEEKTYKSFEELKPQLIEAHEKEYRSLAMKDFLSQFNISEDAVIDMEAVEQILAPYSKAE